MLRLVKIGVEGEGPCTDVMEIRRPDDLVDIANLGLTLAEAKRLLAGVQREIVAAHARDHAVRRPECPRFDGVCRVKDYRDHAVSTLFGQVTLRLPRFRCAACGGIEAGIAWPALPVNIGAGPASGASLRLDDLQDGRGGVGADVPGRRGNAS